MATLPTGSASLRGVGPRAPRFLPGEFDVDPEVFGRAATLPGRVIETVEDLGERRAERRIRDATRPARRTVAVTQAEGAAARAPFEQTVLTEQARGAAGRVGREQVMADRTLGRSEEQFDIQSQQQEAETLRTTAAARRQRAQEDINLADLEENEAEILQAARERRAGDVTRQQVESITASDELMQLEGTPGQRMIETEEGGFVEDFVVTPTGEERVRSTKQVKTPRQIENEQIALESARTRAQAYADQVAAQTQRRVNVRTFKNEDGIGRTIGFTTIVTDATTGEELGVRNTPMSQQAQPAPATNQTGAAAPGATTPRIEQMREGLIETAPPPPAEPVSEMGRQFIPTGNNRGGYRRGIIYSHPTLGRVLYTGGDPFNPASFQPVQ
jgi:predicted RNA-binding protein with TRAM domain